MQNSFFKSIKIVRLFIHSLNEIYLGNFPIFRTKLIVDPKLVKIRSGKNKTTFLFLTHFLLNTAVEKVDLEQCTIHNGANCQHKCDKEKDMVCGTDGRTYLNKCYLQVEYCS